MIKRVKSRSELQVQQRDSFHLSRVKTGISERNFIAGPFISRSMKFHGYFQANVYFVSREKLLVTLAMTICFIHLHGERNNITVNFAKIYLCHEFRLPFPTVSRNTYSWEKYLKLMIMIITLWSFFPENLYL